MNMNTPSKYAIRVTKYGHSDDHLLYGSSHAEAYTLFTGVVERAEQVDGWRTDWIDENTVEMHKPGHTMMLVELVEADIPAQEVPPVQLKVKHSLLSFGQVPAYGVASMRLQGAE